MKLRNEEGSVLVVAIVMLALLTLIGIISVNTATTEIQCANAHYRHTQAFYHAEAGANLALAAAKDRVRALRGNNNWEYWTSPDTFTNTDYSISNMQFSVSIAPKRDGNDHIILWGDMNNDGDFEENLTTGYPVLKIRSAGTAPGGATAVVEILARMDMMFTKIPAPLYSEKGINLSGKAAEAVGEYFRDSLGDECEEGIEAAVNDVVTLLGPSATEFTAHDFCINATCSSPSRPSDQGPGFPIEQTINNLKSRATPITSPVKGTLGSEGEPGIFYCNGDLELQLNSNEWIYGILLVDGNLTVNGGYNAKGITVVKGLITTNGGGGDQVFGALMGKAFATVHGKSNYYYDCRVIQNLKDKYEKYSMLSWMTE